MRLKLFFASILFSLTISAQEVEVVIAAGLDWAQCVAISNNNKFVAKAILNTASIWDTKTGRMIRNVAYAKDMTSAPDSIWFSADNSKLVIKLMSTNNQYQIDIATGESQFIEGPPMDWTNYKYIMSNQMKSTTHLYTSSMKDLAFKSPDGNKEVIYKKVKNPYGNSNVMPYAFEISIKTAHAVLKSADTCYAASFIFSPDSRYLFANQSIYDLELDRLVSDLKMVPYCARSVMFLPETHIPVTASNGSIRIWDFPNVVDIPIPGLVNFKPSYDGKYLVCEKYNTANGQKDFIILDLAKRKQVGPTVSTSETGYLQDISMNGDLFSFLEQKKKNIDSQEIEFSVVIYNRNSGKLVRQIKNCSRAFFTSDPNIMMIDSAGSKNFTYNLTTGKSHPFANYGENLYRSTDPLSTNYFHSMTYTLADFTSGDHKSKVELWDNKTGNKVFEVVEQGVVVSGIQVSRDGKYISFSTDQGNYIYIYEIATKKKLYELKGHTSYVELTYFSNDGKRLISSSIDGTRRVWNLEKGTPMVSLISTGPEDYAILTPQQYYYSTKGAQKLIHFVKGTEIFPFAQFDLKYNRPDIVLESLEASNQELILPFKLAYQKRLARLGFTEEMLSGEFHMPQIVLNNEDEIPFSTDKNKITLKLSAKDPLYNLDRIIIRVNEVPIYGNDGISLREKNIKSFEQDVEIELSTGQNVLSASVMNEKGVESLTSQVLVTYLPNQQQKPNLYLYTIGVSKYKQSGFDLTYAAKDATDVQALFGSNQTVFAKVFTKQLTDAQVTVDAISSLKKELLTTNVDDAVCIFYAGHGLLDIELNYFLASHDIDFTNPSQKGIPYAVFENLLNDIPARKKLVLIDACHSGEIDKEEVVLVENNSENVENLQFRAVTSTTVKTVGLSSSFELMKELFTDIRKSSGAMIISSAGGMEYAMEGAQWNNGVFTYCVLTGLAERKADLNKDGLIMLSEMNEYVREEVFRLTNGRQQPTTRAEVLDSDWQLF